MKYIFAILSLVYISSFAQEFPDKSTYYSYGEKFYSEVYELPHSAKDSVNILVLFKISNSSVQFMQSDNFDAPGNYYAISNFEIYFKDETGIIRNRSNWTDTIYVDQYEETTAKNDYFSSFINVTLKRSKYNIGMKLIGRLLETVAEKEIEFDTKSDADKLFINKPIFVYEESTNSFRPFVLDGNLPFGDFDVKAFFYIEDDKLSSSLTYEIKNEKIQDEGSWNNEIDLSGKIEKITGKEFIIENKDNPYIKIEDKSSANNFSLMRIDIPAELLSPGTYELILKQSTNDTNKINFEVEWNNQPLSFQNPEYAAKSMYYILTDEEYDIIKEGSNKEILKKILKYWKAKDPTPETPYNEAMTEYFRRVDYAFFNYKTLSIPDGSKTERGKIHILYGAPSNVDDELVDGKARQIWEYSNLQKEFVFEKISVGNYRLIEVNNLVEEQIEEEVN